MHTQVRQVGTDTDPHLSNLCEIWKVLLKSARDAREAKKFDEAQRLYTSAISNATRRFGKESPKLEPIVMEWMSFCESLYQEKKRARISS